MKAGAQKASSPVARAGRARPLPRRLDRLIHDWTRLAILAALAARGRASRDGTARG
jgi:hypothetical protein